MPTRCYDNYGKQIVVCSKRTMLNFLDSYCKQLKGVVRGQKIRIFAHKNKHNWNKSSLVSTLIESDYCFEISKSYIEEKRIVIDQVH